MNVALQELLSWWRSAWWRARVREALERADVRGFAAVDDDWYAPIRHMSRSAARYPLTVARAA